MLHFDIYVDRFSVLSKAVTIKLKKEQPRLLAWQLEQSSRRDFLHCRCDG